MAGRKTRIRFIITAGGTREPIDEVRYMGNTSTGRLGAAVAEEAARRGHQTIFIHARDSALPRGGGEMEAYVTSKALRSILERHVREAASPACVVHAAAVADYIPQKQEGKIPSDQRELTLKLKRAVKIVDRIKTWNPGIYLVKFKLEARCTREALIEAGKAAGKKSGADLVVANDVTRISAEKHPAVIIRPDGTVEEMETKAEIARKLVAEIERWL